jgi:uncharacterized protein (DUF1778 family)
MARSQRIELRAEPEREQRIRYAAKLSNQSLTEFMLEAASARAEEVIASVQTTVLAPDFFDELWEALAEPPRPNEKLTRAFRESRTPPVVKRAR